MYLAMLSSRYTYCSLTTSDLLMMEKNNTWLGLPGGETLEAGEDSTHGDPGGYIRSNRVSPECPEPGVQARSKDRHERPQEAGVPGRVIPEEAVGRPIWEVFENPDERILTRDSETGLGSLPASGVITVTMNTSSHSPASLPFCDFYYKN